MDMIERDKAITTSTEDLEVTISEWTAALDESDMARAGRALDDIEAIVRKLRELW